MAPDQHDERPNGPLSWRDVYHAVERSEDKILSRIDEKFDEVGETLAAHDARLRGVERWQASSDDRKAGSSSVWTAQRVVITMALAAAGAIVSVANFIINQVHPPA